MKSFGWPMLMLMSGLSVRASPFPDASRLSVRYNENIHIKTGEQPTDRTIYTVVSLFCMMNIAFLMGYRFTKLKDGALNRKSIIAMLILALYAVIIIFIIFSASLVAGQGLFTDHLCRIGTWVCLVFYASIKVIIYTFLVERIRIVRAPFVRRRNDWIYLSSMAVVVIMYVGVSIHSYLDPVIQMQADDGRCHFGITGVNSITIMCVNVFTDTVLTCVFFYLLRPVGGTDTGLSSRGSAAQKHIRTLVWKSIIGSVAIELSMLGMLIQFVIAKKGQLGMICLTMCLIDITWDVLIINWLTFSSTEAERGLSSAVNKDNRAFVNVRVTYSSRELESRQTQGKGSVEQLSMTDGGTQAYLQGVKVDTAVDTVTAKSAGQSVEDMEFLTQPAN